jgi:hypothetical protein
MVRVPSIIHSQLIKPLVMDYLIANFKQSWNDLVTVLLYSPLITIAISAVILILFWKLLETENTSFRRKLFKGFISSYVVCVCWGLIFAFCMIFISPVQIFNTQNGQLAENARTLSAQNLRTIKSLSYRTNDISMAFDSSGK